MEMFLRVFLLMLGLMSAAAGQTESTIEEVPIPDVTVVTVEMGGFTYQPSMITVKEGETIRLVLVNNDTVQAHSLVIRDLYFKSHQVQPGRTAEFTLKASHPGSFKFYCDVPGHKDAGMVGAIRVEP